MTNIDKDPNNEELPEELEKAIFFIVEKYGKESASTRKQQLKVWKRADEFWHGAQFIFWSESKQDWLSPSETKWWDQEEGREFASGPFYDYVVNIYRAHGESIIAALGAQVPGVRFSPDDPDDKDDVETAKMFSHIAELILKHNKSKIMLLNILMTMFNFGTVFAYHAPKADKAFGVLNIPDIKIDEDGNQIIGEASVAKSRVKIEIWSGLNVAISPYIKDQSETGYLILNTDQPKDFIISLFPSKKDKIEANFQSAPEEDERQARAASNFTARSSEDKASVSFKRIWLRTWTYECLPKYMEEQKKKLKEKYPDGIYVAYTGNTYLESRNENLDKYWTTGKSGLSRYIHSDPLGSPLIPINEITNVLVNLTLETIEQGISTKFADPTVVDFDTYSKHEARPGTVYPAIPKAGSRLSDSFHEEGGARLSKEVPVFADRVEKLAQFTSGSFPSLYGGPSEGKTRTASEYNASRQQALQRLTICWSFLGDFWATLMEKCVNIYVENMVTDEKLVTPGKGKNDFVSTWIVMSKLKGKIGNVEPEASEAFPISQAQKQQVLMRLIEMQNQFVATALFDTSNRELIADLIGLPDLKIPGSDQVNKQKMEIDDLLKGIPIAVDPDVDDHMVHIQTMKNFLVSPEGIETKDLKPDIYALLILHLKAHVNIIAKQVMEQSMGQRAKEPEIK
jgi:hypothetical protein